MYSYTQHDLACQERMGRETVAAMASYESTKSDALKGIEGFRRLRQQVRYAPHLSPLKSESQLVWGDRQSRQNKIHFARNKIEGTHGNFTTNRESSAQIYQKYREWLLSKPKVQLNQSGSTSPTTGADGEQLYCAAQSGPVVTEGIRYVRHGQPKHSFTDVKTKRILKIAG